MDPLNHVRDVFKANPLVNGIQILGMSTCCGRKRAQRKHNGGLGQSIFQGDLSKEAFRAWKKWLVSQACTARLDEWSFWQMFKLLRLHTNGTECEHLFSSATNGTSLQWRLHDKITAAFSGAVGRSWDPLVTAALAFARTHGSSQCHGFGGLLWNPNIWSSQQLWLLTWDWRWQTNNNPGKRDDKHPYWW